MLYTKDQARDIQARRAAWGHKPKRDPIIAAFWDCGFCGDHYSSGDVAQVYRSASNHAALHKKTGGAQGNLAFTKIISRISPIYEAA